jgi:hypothetical protein
MSYSLIQIVSAQTLPNILPALALNPTGVTLLHTKESKKYCAIIENTLRKAGLTPKITLSQIESFLSMQEVGNTVRKAIVETPQGATPVVNFTCGTKLMAIGAFAAAMREKVPSFYFDTYETMHIVDGCTGDLPLVLMEGRKAGEIIKSRLNVDIVAAANGIEEISAGLNPESLRPLALHLLQDPAEASTIRNSLFPNDRAPLDPKTPGDVAGLLYEKPVLDGIISENAKKLAIEGGLLEERGGKLYFVRPASLESLEDFLIAEANDTLGTRLKEWHAARAPLQAAINFFNGAWWELAVFDAAKRSGLFSDLRWSVNISIGGSTFEKDIIAIEGLNLAIFSCKYGGKNDRIIGAIDELDATARQIGGIYARKYFCIAANLPKGQFTTIQEHVKKTRVTLVGPAEKLSPELFHRQRVQNQSH